MPGLSFITPIAYDYKYASLSVPSYYAIADEIILGLDRDRLSWSKKPFAIDMMALRAWIHQIDNDKKIRIEEGDFHSSDDPLVNDTQERSWLSRRCAGGNWIVQIDADEVLLNAAEFRSWLLTTNPTDNRVDARWATIYKSFGNQVLVVDPPAELTPVATMLRGQFTASRNTDQPPIYSPLVLLHFSWGRTEQEVLQKLANWSHSKDVDVQRFFRLWQSVTLENYQQIKNFHPFGTPVWQSLKLENLTIRH